MKLSDYQTPKANAFGFEIPIPGADRPGVVQAVVPYDIAQELEQKLAMCRAVLDDIGDYMSAIGGTKTAESIKNILEITK